MRRPKTRAQALTYLTALVVRAWGDLARNVVRTVGALARNTARAYYNAWVDWS